MMWLIWRQHRKQVLFTALALGVLAPFVIVTGLAMRDTYTDLGLPDCAHAAGEFDEACNQAFNQFNSQYNTLLLAGILFLVLPLLVGLFWGAPLITREVEQGTHRFVWTQGVSRKRWALVKFAFVGVIVLAASVGYGLGVSWWQEPLTNLNANSRFAFFLFDMQGVVPIGYTLFAVALGIFAGTVWPRMLPAMAVTLAGFAGLRIGLAVLARPRYLPAHELTRELGEPAGAGSPGYENAGEWVLAQGVRDSSGKLVAEGFQTGCSLEAVGPGGQQCGAEFGAGAYNWMLYQPADRFWPFQVIEAGVFTALAVLLLVLAIRRVRRIA